MDKSCQSSGDSTTNSSATSTSNSSRDQYLRQLNKFSHKISKPIRRPDFDHNTQIDPPSPPPPPPPSLQQQQQQHQQQQQQPPVYNINKRDFRDVVQKLTGSPAHERFSTPPPIQQPKPPSSRLQRIRPPPLVQISNRPPPLLNHALPPQQPPGAAIMNPNNPMSTSANAAVGNQRPAAPISPLPAFPAVHAAAESPISAYMRYFLASADSDPKRFSGFPSLSPLVSPRWNKNNNPGQYQHLPPPPINNQTPFQMPTSPLPFGCLPSPRSPYPVLSPNLLVSPSTAGQFGFQQFPVSPRLHVPSPRLKNI